MPAATRSASGVTRAEIVDRDLMIAVAELGAGREMLREAYEIAARSERRAAIATALAKLSLASRAIDGVVDTCGEGVG